MIIIEKQNGEFSKDGVNYRIKKSSDQTREEADAEALAAGYVLDLSTARRHKKSEIASARYNAEFGGFTEPNTGIFVRTDGRTRTLLNAAMLRAKDDPSYVIENWKTSDGSFITLDAATVLALDSAVHTFIESQFAKEAALSAQIDAATTRSEIRAITWE